MVIRTSYLKTGEISKIAEAWAGAKTSLEVDKSVD
jgi:hypothetical protein